MLHVNTKHNQTIEQNLCEHLLYIKDECGISVYKKISSLTYDSVLEKLQNIIPNTDIFVEISTKLITDKMLHDNQWIIDIGKYSGPNFTPVYYVPLNNKPEFYKLLNV